MNSDWTAHHPRPSILFRASSTTVLMLLTITPSGPAQSPQATPPATPETHAKGDIAGNWQGTLEAEKAYRIIMAVAKTDKGWSAKVYSIDQGGQGFNSTSTALEGSTLQTLNRHARSSPTPEPSVPMATPSPAPGPRAPSRSHSPSSVPPKKPPGRFPRLRRHPSSWPRTPTPPSTSSP